jgi:RimJ/RimL family protein N-acetyltransferase
MTDRDTHIILKTPRLVIRQFTEDDVDNLVNLNSDPEVMRYLGRPAPREVLRDEIIPFHLGVYQRFDRLGTWAAESASDGEFLGWFHFRAEDGDITNIHLGYRLRRSAWNRGYATEGSMALVNMGFTDLGVQRVFARTMTANDASRRVMEKCGLALVHTGPYHGPDADVIDGAEQGEVEYALTKPEWEARTYSSPPVTPRA